MPQRVKDIRVLIAELQRLASHLIWLGTHAMEIGAVSMLFYAVRERELLLNINELIAGFRFFPSYIRIGGLREDLPRGFHEAVNAFLERFPAKIDEFEGLLTKNDIFRRRTEGVGAITLEDALCSGAWSARSRAPRGSDYDVRKYFPYCGYETYDFKVPTATEGDVYARYRVRVAEMRESVKICQQAIAAHHAVRRVGVRRHARRAAAEGQGLHRDGSADSALPDLLAGLHRAGRRRLRADRGAARRARLLRRVRRHEPAVAREDAGAVVHGDSGAAVDRQGRPHRRRRRGHRLATTSSWETATGELSSADGVRAGAVPPLGAEAGGAGRAVCLHAGEPGEVRRERHALSARSAEVGDSLRALSGAAAAGLHHRRGDAARRRADSLHGRGSRGRRVVLHDVLHEAGRQVRAERLPHAVVRAARRRARHRGAEREARHQARPDDGRRHVHADGSRVPRRLRPRAGGDGERRLARAAGAGAGRAVRRRHPREGQGGVHRLSPARGEESRRNHGATNRSSSNTSASRVPTRSTST